MQSSVPPTTAMSTAPERMSCMPMPIACVADEHAEATAKLGPCMPYRIDRLAGQALGMSLGTVSGLGRPLPISER